MRKILLSFGIALLVVIAFCVPAFAANPVVSVNVISPGNGSVGVTATGVDTSSWHNGATGETNSFNATGAFNASYDSFVGNYGALDTYINASGDADFKTTDIQNFNVLSANHNYNTVGTFTAESSGTNANMNLKSIGSMYVWSEATNPYSASELSGNCISKEYDMETDGSLSSCMLIAAYASNNVSISNSNIWGFGANENGSITTNYDGGTRTISASGSGQYQQYISAGTNADSTGNMLVDSTPVNFNVNLSSGGNANIISNFVNSFSNTYSMTGK